MTGEHFYGKRRWGKFVDLQPYKYSPISPGEIRCLVLKPGRGSKSLSCTLKVYRLADDPHYEAISYIWGDSNRCHEIKCDGARMHITANLRDALRQCRRRYRRRVLWADSICINQDDLGEKSHQVSVMTKIYSQATRVLVCFGPDPTDEAQQMQVLLRKFNEMFLDVVKNIKGKWDAFPGPSSIDPLFKDPGWWSIKTLTCHPWFDRGWVVQEAGLARDALILWGEAQINWRWLLRMVFWGSRFTAWGFSGLTTHMDMYALRYKEEVMPLCAENAFREANLLSFLYPTGSLSVTDDRDRIYAFLGVPQAADIRDALDIDYKKDAPQVYQDFACVYLDYTHDLRLLHYIQPNEGTLSVESVYPSWIPDWGQHTYPLLIYNISKEKIRSQNPSTSLFCSRVGTNILKVRALIADSLAFLSSPLLASMTTSDIAAVWKEVKGYTGKLAYKQSILRRVFLETMRNGSRPAYLDREQVREYAQAFVDGLDHDAPEVSEGASPASMDPEKGGLDDPMAEMWAIVQSQVHQRRVAITQRGHYCLIPSLAREGDTCAIIFGTTEPFILRSAGGQDRYKVVGDAFVVSSQINDSLGDMSSYRMGSGSTGYEDWLDWNLEEKEIALC